MVMIQNIVDQRPKAAKQIEAKANVLNIEKRNCIPLPPHPIACPAACGANDDHAPLVADYFMIDSLPLAVVAYGDVESSL